jgi:membrane fusion protein, protease secretion system
MTMAFELSNPKPASPAIVQQAVPGAGLPSTEAALLQLMEMDIRKPQKFGWLVLLIGFVGFLMWAAFVPLEKGAALHGTVTVTGNKKTLQHPYGGVIDAILVNEGDTVKKNQVLMRMNATRSEAELGVVRTQWITLKSVEARLVAEMSGSKVVNFDAWLIQNEADPRVKISVENQQALFGSRTAALRSELAALTQTENALMNSIDGLRASLKNKQSQVTYSESQLEGLRMMAEQGYLANNKLLEAEKQNSAVSGSMSEEQSNIARLVGQLGEVRMKKAQRKSEFVAQTQNELTDVQRQLEELENKLRAVNQDNDYLEIKSPADGTVIDLQYFTTGGVVTPGGKLMDIIPQGEPLEIEARLEVQLIDKVQKGLPADILFTAFNTRTTPHFEGRVTTVSPDRFVDERTGEPYYLVKVQLNTDKAAALSKLDLQPGMPAQLFIKNGERTLLNYLLKPLMERLRFSLNEE